ncbi:MAG: prepilin-type N-terminal cleavage/methylation domain-containing protein [Planctomycetota bacterium]
MRRTANRARRAFTLIELLVVIAIIIIIATVSLVLIQSLTKGQSVKSGGRITQGAFAKARQLAAAQRVTHFLVFANGTDPATGMATGRMEVHRDVNRNNVFDPPYANSADVIVDQAIMVPKGLRFRLRGANNYPQQSTPAWLAFLSDGSIVQDATYFPNPDVPSSQYDADFGAGNLTWSRADLTLEQSSGAPGKVYLDYTPPTGKLRKLVYWEN